MIDFSNITYCIFDKAQFDAKTEQEKNDIISGFQQSSQSIISLNKSLRTSIDSTSSMMKCKIESSPLVGTGINSQSYNKENIMNILSTSAWLEAE